MNKYTWYNRQGQALDIRNMDNDYFHNLVNYLFVECSRHNTRVFRHFQSVILEELQRRNMNLSEILNQGAKVYKDEFGISRLWDEETNSELALN